MGYLDIANSAVPRKSVLDIANSAPVKTSLPSDIMGVDVRPAQDLFFKNPLQFAIDRAARASQAGQLFPMVSAIAPVPEERLGLGVLAWPFQQISKATSTALAGWPTAEQEFAKVQKPMDVFGALGKTLTSTTFPQLYEQAGYSPEVSQGLGTLLDLAAQVYAPHIAARATVPAYRSLLGVKETVKAGVQSAARGILSEMELKALKSDFVNKYSPIYGKEKAQLAADLAWKMIKEKQATGAPIEIPLKQLFGIERPIQRPIEQIVTIPKAEVVKPAISFKNTNEAVSYGKSIVGNQVKINELIAEGNRLETAIKPLRGVKGQEQAGYDLAVKKQLINEALTEATKPVGPQQAAQARLEARKGIVQKPEIVPPIAPVSPVEGLVEANLKDIIGKVKKAKAPKVEAPKPIAEQQMDLRMRAIKGDQVAIDKLTLMGVKIEKDQKGRITSIGKIPAKYTEKELKTTFEYQGKTHDMEELFDVVNAVKAGTPGAKYFTYDENENLIITGNESSMPKWMQDWNKSNPKQFISQKDVVNTFNALRAGKVLGKKQQLTLDLMMGELPEPDAEAPKEGKPIEIMAGEEKAPVIGEEVIKTGISTGGNWEIGQERPFAFDPNSTKNEGRFRLLSPDTIQKNTYFRRKSSTKGVSYVMGKDTSGKEMIQAIRFDKSKFSEQQAAEWWEQNKGKYQFNQVIQSELKPQPQAEGVAKDLFVEKPVEKPIAGQQTVNELISSGKVTVKDLESRAKKSLFKLGVKIKQDIDDGVQSVLKSLLQSKSTYDPSQPLDNWLNSRIKGYAQNASKEIFGPRRQVVRPESLEAMAEKGVEPIAEMRIDEKLEPSEVKKITLRVNEIVATMEPLEAQKQLRKEFGVNISVEKITEQRRQAKGGVPVSFFDNFIPDIVKEILVGKPELKGATLGLEDMVDLTEEQIISELGHAGIVAPKEAVKNIIKSVKENLHNLEVVQQYLYSYKDSKAIAYGITDAHAQYWSYNEFVAGTFYDLINKADNKEKLARVLYEADRLEREDGKEIDVEGIIKRGVKEGKFTEKDLLAYQGFDAIRNFIRDRITQMILESKLGIRAKSLGRFNTVTWTTKDGTMRQSNLSQAQLMAKIERFGEGNVKSSRAFEKVRIRKFDQKTGKYDSRVIEVNKYDEVIRELRIEEKKLIESLLPYRNWIPHSRYGGPKDWWVEIFDAETYEENKDARKLGSYRVPDKATAEKIGELFKKQMGEKGVSVEISPHGYHHAYNVSFGSPTDLMYYFWSLGVNPTTKMAQRVINAQRSMSPLLDSIIHATNVPGYRTDWDGITKNLRIKADATSRSMLREDLRELVPLIENINPEATQRRRAADLYLKDLIEGSIMNDPLSRTLMTLNSLLYVKALANKLTYITQNMTEPVWALSLALSDIPASKWFGFTLPLGKDYGELTSRAIKEGLIKTRIYESAPFSHVLQKINVLGNATERFSSLKVFDLGLRLARAKGIDAGEEAYVFAKRFLMNDGKPFYNQANKLVGTVGPGYKAVRNFGFTLINWPLWWANKFIRNPIKAKIGWIISLILLTGIGGLPFGRRIWKKLGWDKPVDQWSAFDKFLLAGFPGLLGVDSRYLQPLFTKGLEDVGSLMRGINYYRSQFKGLFSNIDKYGSGAALFPLPLGGLEFIIAGHTKAEMGIMRGEKLFFKPRDAQEKFIMQLSLTPLRLGEKYQQEALKKKPWWKK